MSNSGPQCICIWTVREHRIMTRAGPTVFGSTYTDNTTYPRMLAYWHVSEYTTLFKGCFYCSIVVILLFIIKSWKVVMVEFEIGRLQVKPVYMLLFTFYLNWWLFYLKLYFTYVQNAVLSYIVLSFAGSIFRVMQNLFKFNVLTGGRFFFWLVKINVGVGSCVFWVWQPCWMVQIKPWIQYKTKTVSLSSPPPSHSGTTEKTLVDVLTKRSNAQRLLIAKAYEKATGRVK